MPLLIIVASQLVITLVRVVKILPLTPIKRNRGLLLPNNKGLLQPYRASRKIRRRKKRKIQLIKQIPHKRPTKRKRLLIPLY